jgi:hypothetical protein
MTALQALSIHEDAVLECKQRNVNTASPSVTCNHYSASQSQRSLRRLESQRRMFHERVTKAGLKSASLALDRIPHLARGCLHEIYPHCFHRLSGFPVVDKVGHLAEREPKEEIPLS